MLGYLAAQPELLDSDCSGQRGTGCPESQSCEVCLTCCAGPAAALLSHLSALPHPPGVRARVPSGHSVFERDASSGVFRPPRHG